MVEPYKLKANRIAIDIMEKSTPKGVGFRIMVRGITPRT